MTAGPLQPVALLGPSWTPPRGSFVLIMQWGEDGVKITKTGVCPFSCPTMPEPCPRIALVFVIWGLGIKKEGFAPLLVVLVVGHIFADGIAE